MSEKVDGEWWSINAGIYCGVFMPIDVMKKVAKITTKYESDIRDVLRSNADRLLASDWTMSKLPDPVYLHFTQGDDVERRISLFKSYLQPKRVDVYRCTRKEATEIANAIADAMLAEEDA